MSNDSDYIKSIQDIVTEMMNVQISFISFMDEQISIDSLLNDLQKFHIFDDKCKFHDFLNILNSMSFINKFSKLPIKLKDIYKLKIFYLFQKVLIYHFRKCRICNK